MPTNVPASISPFPATNASPVKKSGKIPYLSGEKNVACTPRPNSTAISTGKFPVKKPIQASSIKPSSQILTARISRDFSLASASCPAMAEKIA